MHLKYINMRLWQNREASCSGEQGVFTHIQRQWLAWGNRQHLSVYVCGFHPGVVLQTEQVVPYKIRQGSFQLQHPFFSPLYFSLWYWDTQGSNRLFTPSWLQNSFYLRLPQSAEFSCFESSQRSLQISSLWKVTCQGIHFSWLTTSI